MPAFYSSSAEAARDLERKRNPHGWFKDKMIQQIAFLNQSQGDLSDDEVDLIARACAVQLDQHFAPAWGQLPWDAQFYEDVRAAPPGAILHYMLKDAGSAGYLGFHDTDKDGNAYIKTFTHATLAGGGTKYETVDSISCTASHECTEVALDRDAIEYVVMPDGLLLPSGKVTNGTLMAREAADVCEGDGYAIRLAASGGGTEGDVKMVDVFVSDFVHPAYFLHSAPKNSQFDQMGLMKGSWEMRPGSYAILLQANNAWQEFAKQEGPPLARMKDKSVKKHPSARTHRRLKSFGVVTP